MTRQEIVIHITRRKVKAATMLQSICSEGFILRLWVALKGEKVVGVEGED